jgi:tRNA modification GTPase
VRNKSDLQQASPVFENNIFPVVSISAKTGEGLPVLKNQIKSMVGFQPAGEGIYLARRRHLDALSRASDTLTTAASTLLSTQAIELFAEELRLCQNALSEITGAFTPDDLLGRIFSTFCIGK